MEKPNFELLLVKEKPDSYIVKDVTYSNAFNPDSSGLKPLRASLYAIEGVKKALAEGKNVWIPKPTAYSEVQYSEVMTCEMTGLELAKRKALASLQSRMNNAIFNVNVIDSMTYLDSYMRLLNGGIFITDENRDEKLFEVIDAAQSVEEPPELPENATYEEEVARAEAKKKYDTAQTNLATLEKYLNSYDKLVKIRYIADIIDSARKNVEIAATEEEVAAAMSDFAERTKTAIL